MTKKSTEARIKAFEMWCYRRMDRVSWREKKSNENVLKNIRIKTTFLETIKRRRLGFYGHTRRHETLQKMTMEGMVEGTRGRGRKRTTWTGNITEYLRRWQWTERSGES